MRLPLTKLRESLTEGGRGYAGTLWRRFGANLVVVELAIAVVLLVGAGLLGKSFYRLLHVEVGFQTDHLATLQVALSDASYPKDEQIVAVERQILKRVAVLTRRPIGGHLQRVARELQWKHGVDPLCGPAL